MEYIVIILATFIFTRYAIKIVDVITECISIQFSSMINDKNIEIGMKTKEFEEFCNSEVVELQPRIGFQFEPDEDEEIYEDDDYEDDDDEEEEW